MSVSEPIQESQHMKYDIFSNRKKGWKNTNKTYTRINIESKDLSLQNEFMSFVGT